MPGECESQPTDIETSMVSDVKSVGFDIWKFIGSNLQYIGTSFTGVNTRSKVTGFVFIKFIYSGILNHPRSLSPSVSENYIFKVSVVRMMQQS